MFIISHLPPNLIRLLRVCLNLGKANDTMDSFIKNVLVDIAEDIIQDFHDDQGHPTRI